MLRASVRAAGLAAMAGGVIFLAACKQETRSDQTRVTNSTLEGTVTYKGEKVPYALVIVVGDGMSATGRVEEDGRYKVENCPVGEVQVAVNTEAGRGDYMSASRRAGADKKAPAKFVEVPKQYHEPTTTPLRFTTKQGANTYDIAIPR
jgi:hypothetical protein